jgi:acetyl esterase/lipase
VVPIDRRRFLLTASGAVFGAQLPNLGHAIDDGVTTNTYAYAAPMGQELLLDIYRPADSRKPLPVIVFLHGGGWFTGSRKMAPDLKRYFAQDGYAMVSIDYRLTPSITFPSNLEDVKTAIRWIRANSKAYNLDSNRIGLWGTSAGGYLAAMSALTPETTFAGQADLQYASSVRCVLDAYGPVAFQLMDQQTEQEKTLLQSVATPLVSTSSVPPPPQVLVDDVSSPPSRLMGAPVQTILDKVKAASPLSYIGKGGTPPFLLMHGLADGTVAHAQSVMLYDALAASGVEVTLRLVDGLPHTFFNLPSVDELAGPFEMHVRQSKHRRERVYVERAKVFAVARDFFAMHLK